MRRMKIAGEALAALLLAGCAALAAGTWIFPAEKDLIASFAGFRLSIAGIGAGLSLLTLAGFARGWTRLARGENSGTWRNGIGFGLLPAAAVWKVFEHRTLLGQGKELPEGLPRLPGLSGEGMAFPSRAELCLAALLFGILVFWLAARKRELAEGGDLLGVSASCWAAARMVTEHFRLHQILIPDDFRIAGWAAAAVLALTLGIWTARAFRQHKNTGYAFACVPVFAASVAGIVLIQNEILGTGIPAADLAGQVCFALLALKAVLCMGRVTRS